MIFLILLGVALAAGAAVVPSNDGRVAAFLAVGLRMALVVVVAALFVVYSGELAAFFTGGGSK